LLCLIVHCTAVLCCCTAVAEYQARLYCCCTTVAVSPSGTCH
jgi:hypothetical protein